MCFKQKRRNPINTRGKADTLLQEKTRKIVEIWGKAGTFPPACLERLSSRLESPNYDPPPPIMSPALPPVDQGSVAALPLRGYSRGNGEGEWLFWLVIVSACWGRKRGVPQERAVMCATGIQQRTGHLQVTQATGQIVKILPGEALDPRSCAGHTDVADPSTRHGACRPRRPGMHPLRRAMFQARPCLIPSLPLA